MFAWDAGDGGRLSNMDQFDETSLSSSNQSSIFVFKKCLEEAKKRVCEWRKQQENCQSNDDGLKKKLWKTESLLNNAETKLNIVTKEKEICENELAILKSSLEKANAENFKTCSDSCKLENELERLHDENDRQKSRILQLETDLERKNTEQVEVVEMCKMLEDKLAKRNEACANLALAKGEEQQDFENKMEEMTKNYNKVSQLSENLAARFKDQESISERAMEEIEALQTQLKAATQSNTKYKARSKILISKMEKINKKQKELQFLNKIKQENSNLKAEIAMLQENLAKESLGLKGPENEALLCNKWDQVQIPLRKSTQKAIFTLKQELARYEKIYIASQEKVKELEQNQNNFMAAENQYRNVIKRLQRNLTEARHELKVKTKEDAELQKLQLITEFEMSNCQRLTSERENELKIKQQREEVLFKRNLELEGEMKELRYQLHLKSKDGSLSDRSDFDERVFVNQMVTRLRLSRKKFDETKEQFINNDFMQIKQLQQKLKSKDDKYKRAQIELNVMKDELERVKQQQQQQHQQPSRVAKKQLALDLDESDDPDIGI